MFLTFLSYNTSTYNPETTYFSYFLSNDRLITQKITQLYGMYLCTCCTSKIKCKKREEKRRENRKYPILLIWLQTFSHCKKKREPNGNYLTTKCIQTYLRCIWISLYKKRIFETLCKTHFQKCREKTSVLLEKLFGCTKCKGSSKQQQKPHLLFQSVRTILKSWKRST